MKRSEVNTSKTENARDGKVCKLKLETEIKQADTNVNDRKDDTSGYGPCITYAHVTKSDGKSEIKSQSVNDQAKDARKRPDSSVGVTLTSQLSQASDTNDDVQDNLYKVKSKKGAKIGSESLITDNDLLLSATLVANAMEGKTCDVRREPRYVRSYNLFKSIYMRLLHYTAIMVILLLAVFEKPSMPNLSLPYWITMTIEVICQMVFIFRICHTVHWRVSKSFKRDLKMILAISCIVSFYDNLKVASHDVYVCWYFETPKQITLLDMIAYVFVVEFSDYKGVRVSRVLRPLFIGLLSDGVHLKRAWSNIRMTLKQISHVIGMFYFLIIVFALVAIKLFKHRTDIKFPNGKEYFSEYRESFWELYVLVTTANNPDVMLPAYEVNRGYCLFFTSYIILCLYLILNILLAVTYNSYRENMKNQIKHSAKMKRKVLQQAFEVIKINKDGKEMVTYKTWTRLINLAHPGVTKHQIDLLMMVLDRERTGYISRQEFLNIADLLNVPISVVSERKNFMELHCENLYMSRCSKALRRMVDSMYFRVAFDIIVLVNVILIALNVDQANWGFCSLYVIEIILKWYTFGTKEYFQNFQNWVDVLITVLSLVVLIVTTVEGSTKETLSVFNTFRIFRILRCLLDFERFRIIFDAVFNVSYSILTYCTIIFIIFYCYAIVGMELFAGYIQYTGVNSTATYCNNSALNGSVFVANNYCIVNFNDFLNSIVLIASLLIVNNWHVICEGYVLVTNEAARLFFMSFHLCIAVVIMNIVTAFILDMFMYEYTFSKKGYLDTKVEMTIKNLQLGLEDKTGGEPEEEKNKEEVDAGQKGHSMLHTKKLIQKLAEKQNAHQQVKPNLTQFDGIRFHLKTRDWTRTELLLQQLFELEEEVNEADKDHQLISMLD